MSEEKALHAAATTRNRDPILAVLRQVLPQEGLLLEIAAGTGEHAAYFAAAFPDLLWQASDPDPDARSSIAAHAARAALPNLLPPLDLDMEQADWDKTLKAIPDAILAINLLHISPWRATEGLLKGAARLLPFGAPLILYGPFRRKGVATAPSNEAFDASLKARDLRWGLRLLEDVADLAEAQGLTLDRVVEMPANNLTVVFRRASETQSRA